MNELDRLLVLYVGLTMINNPDDDEIGMTIGIENRIYEIRPDLEQNQDEFKQVCKNALLVAADEL